jgi:hypothetical protein
MRFFLSLITVIAKFFGIHLKKETAPQPTPSQVTSSPITLTIEKAAVAVVGGGRRPARLLGKQVRITCPWYVIKHVDDTVLLSRSLAIRVFDVALETPVARIKKIGAGRPPEDLGGRAVRVVSTWTVREDRGDVVVLATNSV